MALVALSAVVAFGVVTAVDRGWIGSSSTRVVVPSRGQTTYSFTYHCGPDPIGIQVQRGSRYSFLSPVRDAGSPLPPGHVLRIRRRWFHAIDYTFIGDDSRVVELQEFDHFAIAACP